MKLKTKLMSIAMLPLIIATIVTSIILYIRVTEVVGNQVKDSLLSIAIMERDNISLDGENKYHLDESGNLWNGNILNITQAVAAVEELKEETEVDVTVFYGDTRYMTTIKEGGKPILGTKAGDAVVEAVLKKGENYFSNEVDVLGEPYYGMYVPYYNTGETEPAGIVFTGMTQKYVKKEIRDILFTAVIVMIVILLLSVVLIYLIADHMAKRIRQGVNTLVELEKGNLLSEKIKLKGKDEITEIVESVQKVQDELVHVVGNIVENSKKVYSVADKMNKNVNNTQSNLEQANRAVLEIAEGATSQAADTQSATENVMTMGNLIQETKSNVNRLNENADDMEQNAIYAKETLKNLEAVNENVKVAIEAIYEQTNNTNESAQKISEAIHIITSIAEETNLLALNASIEAARAGEHGKGFAVVASEIQSLAEQSNSSAMQIEESIKVLMKDSETAVATMEQVKQIMLEQSTMVEKTDEKFREVMEGIETSRKDIGCILNNSQDLNESKEQVVEIVQNLSAISEEYAASTEETSASVTEVTAGVEEMVVNADTLQDIAKELQESVQRFQV